MKTKIVEIELYHRCNCRGEKMFCLRTKSSKGVSNLEYFYSEIEAVEKMRGYLIESSEYMTNLISRMKIEITKDFDL